MEAQISSATQHALVQLSSKSRSILAMRDVVIDEWEIKLRVEVQRAKTLKQPILINTLPTFFEKLAYLLTPAMHLAGDVDTSTIATEHGGERARISGYDVPALIHEFQLFRKVLFGVLARNSLRLDRSEADAINAAIDAAIRDSVTAFALVHTALREQFVAALTHDLRTPLSNVRLAAQLIEAGDDPDKMRQLARKIVDNTSRMDRMIHELLDTLVFHSDEQLPLHIEPFDMRAMAEEVVGQSVALHGLPVSVTGAHVDGWWCRESVKRCIENLLSNAVKYGTRGSPITVAISTSHGKVQIAVHNEGDVIPPDQMETIFQIYRRAEAAKAGNQDGWGIGLPYVRRVAESHGGTVTVTSDGQTGTTFTLDLPIDARPYPDAPHLS